MPLSEDEVRRIAWLARIRISDAEVLATQTQLNRILGLIEQMQKIDTAGIEPMAHAQDVMLRLREDRVTESDQRELYQSKFVVPPERVEAGLYLVPKVIE